MADVVDVPADEPPLNNQSRLCFGRVNSARMTHPIEGCRPEVRDTSLMDAVVGRRARLALPRRALRLVGDERLVDELRAGSVGAFEEIYDRHHGGILAFCRHMLGSQQEAEDAVQHTFIAAYRSLVADERQIALKAWLYVVARNRCLSLLRARHEDADIDDAATVMPETGGLAAEVEGREDLRALLADLQLLPEDQRAALVLAELQAHSHNEIAVILTVPPAKVKALVFQAREALMNRRLARGANCAEIREQLAVVRGSALRRGQLRHHVEQCEGCRAFAGEVRSQRAAFCVLLPVVPSLALKHSTLTAALAAGSSGAVAAGGAVAGGAATMTGATASATTGATAASATAGGTAAAGGGAAAGSVAGASGSAGFASGGALLGAKAIAAKGMIALAVTGIAGGGYVAVEQHASDRSPAAPAHATLPPSGQAPKPKAKPSVGAVVGSSTADNCVKAPATARHACPGHASATKADRDADGVPNRRDACPSTPANTLNGCPDGAPALLAPAVLTPGGRTLADRDGDGVPNRRDACPSTPANTLNGCLDGAPAVLTPAVRTPGGRTLADRDGDGVPNRRDACPSTPANTLNGCLDGAPAVLTPGGRPLADRDGDGVPNRRDACPSTLANTMNGCPDNAPADRTPGGRPLADRDGDGVPNRQDACPSTPANTPNGCPDGAPADLTPGGRPLADRDGDGVPNRQDACPKQPANTPSGCPDPTPSNPAAPPP